MSRVVWADSLIENDENQDYLKILREETKLNISEAKTI
jgi:hypothetical protein